MSIGKKILITILIIISFGCIVLDGWFAYILFFAPQKVVSNTYIIGEQKINKIDSITGEVVEETKPFIEVNIFNNAFEIKYNEMFDENQNNYYTHGMQYISKNGFDSVNFQVEKKLSDSEYDMSNYKILVDRNDPDTHETVGSNWLGVDFENWYYNDSHIVEAKAFQYLNFYEYQNSADSGFVSNHTAPMSKDKLFKLQIDGELFGMKPKYDEVGFNNDYYIGSNYDFVSQKGMFGAICTYDVDHYYRAIDIHYVNSLVYHSVSSVAKGTSQDIVLKFADYFFYYEEENSVYTRIVQPEITNKLVEYVNNYYVIRVNSFDYDLDSSEKSMFNCYKGNQNVSEENVSNEYLDYTMSKTIVSLNLEDFNFVETTVSGEYVFKLKKQIIDSIYVNKDVVLFDINLDLTSTGIDFLGIDKESLQGYEVLSAKVKIIDNGSIVERQVHYV